MKIKRSFLTKKDNTFSALNYFNTPKEYNVIYGWSWNDTLTKEEIIKQLDDIKNLNIKCLYVLPEPKEFRPSSMPSDLGVKYLSKEYFDFYRFTILEAKKRGINLWLYDEGGWPSGSACGQVLNNDSSLHRRVLAVKTITYSKGSVYSKPKNVFVSFINKTQIIKNGYLFTEDTEVEEYYSKELGVGSVNADFPDLLVKKSTDDFIKLTHEKYKNNLNELFKKEIFAIFTDEPKASGEFPLRKEIIKAFKRKYGYSLLPYLPCIYYGETASEKDKKAVIDYYELLSELLNKNFILKCRKWSNANGMAFTGHLDKDDDIVGAYKVGFNFSALRALRGFDIPGIDAIWRQIWHKKHDDSALFDFFPRMASSASMQNGSGKSITETFGVYGFTSYEEMRYVVGAQAIRGINLFNFLSIAYGEKNNPFSTCFSNWAYPHLSKINEYTARLSYISSIGVMQNEIAMYMPNKEMHLASLRDKIATEFKLVGDALEDNGIPFDIVDDDYILCANKKEVNKGRLALNLANYSKVIIPYAEMLDKKVSCVLEKFILGGGKVYTLCDKVAKKVKGSILIESVNNLFTFDNRVKYEKGILPLKRKLENGEMLLFYNGSDSDKTVEFLGKENAYILNITSGEIESIKDKTVLLSGETIAILIINEKLNAARPISVSNKTINLNSFTFSKTEKLTIEKNTRSKESINGSESDVNLGDWKYLAGKRFSGTGVYKTTFNYNGENSLMLSLGKVKNSCEVIINGNSLGVKVYSPYNFKIERAYLKENNLLEIKVTNSHANEFLHAFNESDNIKPSPYHKRIIKIAEDSLESGLFGPVTITEIK